MASIDEDGDLKLFAEVDGSRGFVKFYTGWRRGESISDSRLYKILNAWNSDRIFATAVYYKSGIRLEYFLATNGGIDAENLNATVEWLFTLAETFEDYLYEEDAI